MRMLVAYGSDQGQTRKIAERISDVLTADGHTVDLVNTRTIPVAASIAHYNAIIVGASVHASKFQGYVIDFVSTHRHQLQRLPSALFSVSLWAAHPDARERARLDPIIENFLDEMDWRPDKIASFAGAIPRTRGGSWLMRRVFWRGLRSDGVATDTAAHEYTNWTNVERFAHGVAALAEAQLAAA